MAHTHRVVVATCMLALIACGAPGESAAPTRQATAADQPFLTAVDSYIDVDTPDGEFITLASRACDRLAETRDLVDTSQTVADESDLTLNEAAAVTGSAVRYYCREFAYLGQ